MSTVELILAIIGGLVVLIALLLVGFLALVGAQTCMDEIKDELVRSERREPYYRERTAIRQLDGIDRLSDEAMIGSIVRHLPSADRHIHSIGGYRHP